MNNQERCHHCDTEITDRSTMVQKDGQTYCCQNCCNAMERKS
ncbi:MAG: hypothetical protein ACR2HN_05305 [Tepidiformaceae bacterium]